MASIRRNLTIVNTKDRPFMAIIWPAITGGACELRLDDRHDALASSRQALALYDPWKLSWSYDKQVVNICRNICVWYMRILSPGNFVINHLISDNLTRFVIVVLGQGYSTIWVANSYRVSIKKKLTCQHYLASYFFFFIFFWQLRDSADKVKWSFVGCHSTGLKSN